MPESWTRFVGVWTLAEASGPYLLKRHVETSMNVWDVCKEGCYACRAMICTTASGGGPRFGPRSWSRLAQAKQVRGGSCSASKQGRGVLVIASPIVAPRPPTSHRGGAVNLVCWFGLLVWLQGTSPGRGVVPHPSDHTYTPKIRSPPQGKKSRYLLKA